MKKIISTFVVCFIGTSCAMNPHNVPNGIANTNCYNQCDILPQEVNAYNQYIDSYMQIIPLQLDAPMVNAMNVHQQYQVYCYPQVQYTMPINVNANYMLGWQHANVPNLVLQPRNMQGVNIQPKKVNQGALKVKENLKADKPRKRSAVNKKSSGAPDEAKKPRRLRLTKANLSKLDPLTRAKQLARVKEYIENAEKDMAAGDVLYPINLYE